MRTHRWVRLVYRKSVNVNEIDAKAGSGGLLLVASFAYESGVTNSRNTVLCHARRAAPLTLGGLTPSSSSVTPQSSESSLVVLVLILLSLSLKPEINLIRADVRVSMSIAPHIRIWARQSQFRGQAVHQQGLEARALALSAWAHHPTGLVK